MIPVSGRLGLCSHGELSFPTADGACSLTYSPPPTLLFRVETLSPLGIVVNQKSLGKRAVVVVENGTVLCLVDEETDKIEVVHPNEDGSYWRKFQRNKKVRLEEKAREALAKSWLASKRPLV